MFANDFCSEGEHKVRPYIGFGHWVSITTIYPKIYDRLLSGFNDGYYYDQSALTGDVLELRDAIFILQNLSEIKPQAGL